MTQVTSTSLAMIKVVDLIGPEGSRDDVVLAIQLRDVLDTMIDNARHILRHIAKEIDLGEMRVNAVLLVKDVEIGDIERYLFLGADGVMFTAIPGRFSDDDPESEPSWYHRYDAAEGNTWEHVEFGKLLAALDAVLDEKKQGLRKYANGLERYQEALARIQGPLRLKGRDGINDIEAAAEAAFGKKR